MNYRCRSTLNYGKVITLWLLFVLTSLSCSSNEPMIPSFSDHGATEQESVLSQGHSGDDARASSQADFHSREKKDSLQNRKRVSVDDLLSEMTLREKIGQLFFIRANGDFLNEQSRDYQELVSKIKNYHVGGLIFFNGHIYGQTILTNKLQNISDIPLWITQDMEYGAAMRVEGTTRFVPAMGIAATQNPNYAFWAGKITAQEAKALGVHQVFAPVLDVNNNPDNPVINVRSFSANPDTVARYGKRFIEGVQSEGIVSTAKHFPGHGDTDIDSHISLPVINYDYSRLDSVELVPFRMAVNNNISSIMSAHIAFPKIGSQPNLPATLNPSVLNRILTDSLNFDGLVVTDGLEMRGISAHFSPGEAVIKALKAGVDLMLLSPDELTAIREIEVAVQKGELSEQRIDQSVRKLLLWKKQFGLFEKAATDIDELSRKIHTPESQLLADEISRKSLTLLKNENYLLPIRSSEYPTVLALSVADDRSGETGQSLASEMRKYHPNVISHVLDRRSSEEEKREILRDARKADLLVIGSFIYVRSGQSVQIPDEHLDFLDKLQERKPSVLIAFGNPYVVRDLEDSEVQLLAWAANEAQIANTIPALFGGTEISGKLPITIPGMYEANTGVRLPKTSLRHDEPEVVGLSRDSLKKVDHIMREAIFDSTFPGGVVAVAKDGVIAYQKGFGYRTYEKLKPVTASDIYDLASLTKVVATTPSIMKLVEQGKISLDDKVSDYIPEFNEGDKKQITIRNLLLHNSGLPAFRVYIDSLKTREEIIEAVKNEPLIQKPGTTYTYSDLGFILLGEIIETVSGKPLDEYVRSTFYYPLGMSSTFFNPKKAGRWISRRIPPTEKDTLFRMKTLRGEVHDERAWYMDGVAGHAGLFSTAGDLATYTQMLLNNGSYAGFQYLRPATIRIFAKRQSELVNRGYGFDRKSSGFSTAGSLTSDKTFGHTGFTGTSFWIDPERNLSIIILTNRTYPFRSYGENISEVRAAVADAVVSSITK